MDINQIAKPTKQNAINRHSDISSKNVTKAFGVAMLLETVLSEDIDMDKEIIHGAVVRHNETYGLLRDSDTLVSAIIVHGSIDIQCY